MNRYFIYLVILNMLANVTSYVPQILIKYRFHGSVESILLAVPIGLLLMTLFTRALSRFPGQGLPEIIPSLFPQWVRWLVMPYLALIWYSAGALSLLAINEITIRFINPETPLFVGMFMYVIVVGVVSQMRTDKVLYFLEIMLVFSVPLMLIVLVKSFLTHSINWDSVLTVGQSYSHPPTWTTLSSATYLFSGYTNMAIFNRVFVKPVKLGWLWAAAIGAAGLGILLVTFMVPIGFQGADGVGSYTHPWLITTDSMTIELGFIERVMYVFLLLYSGLSICSSVVHWHVSAEFIKSQIASGKQHTGSNRWLGGAIAAVFMAAAIGLGYFFTDENMQKNGIDWLKVRLGSEVALVLLIGYAVMRRKT